MNKQWKRSLITGLLSTSLLVLAGCGSQNVIDNYSFGNQVIRFGQSEITIALPYEMGKSLQSTSDDGYPMDLYGSSSKHMMIEVKAIQGAPDKPLPSVADYVKGKEANFSGVTGSYTVTPVDLNGTTATHINGTFSVQNRNLSVSQYIFMNEGVLWNITYTYPLDDQVGADISKEIEHKIYVTQKKEG